MRLMPCMVAFAQCLPLLSAMVLGHLVSFVLERHVGTYPVFFVLLEGVKTFGLWVAIRR